MATLTLLGPQRLHPNLVDEVDRLGIEGPIAAITAGWQEREAEDDELRTHLHRPVVNLRLHRRSEQLFADDPELFAAHRARQDRLRAMQRLYRYRLDFALEPARELLRREGDPQLLEPECEAAIDAVRRLDAEHLGRLDEVHRAFEKEHAPARRKAVRRHRRELAETLEGVAALAVAGGHVAVLLNRMRLFGVAELAAELPIFAWSAGAMALAERVVLFHDSPPQGAGNAEVLDLGLGLAHGLVPLPHARRRLRLDDPCRVALFARRFAPALAVPLEEAVALAWADGRWQPLAGDVRHLAAAGRIDELEAA